MSADEEIVAGKQILVVEDDTDILAMIRTVLELRGAAVDAVTTAAEARSRVGRQTFDALILDWNLPDTSGDEFLLWLERHQPDLACRCVVITGHMLSSRELDEAENSGAAFLAKPFRPAALIAAVASVLSS
ncbi:MAG: response regulator [Candidatus Dadabacteria bacterium]|nr:MAG: response regulator [Candidatus Dadabacteria bacterium]